MAKYIGELVEDLRDRLNEETPRSWEDDQLIRWINEGARDVARRGEVLWDRYDITAVTGTQEYTLPTTVIRVHRVEWIPTGSDQKYPLEYRQFSNMDSVWWTGQSSSQSTPMYFTMWGFPPALKLIVFPKPPSAGILKVFYYRMPTEAAGSGNTLEIPEGWHDLAVDYAEYKALRKDANPRWAEAKALYEENLQHMMDVTATWSDQAGMIDFNGAMVPAWLYSMED